MDTSSRLQSCVVTKGHLRGTKRSERVLRLRPLRGTDVPALRRFIARIDPEDLRLRFHGTMRDMTDAKLVDLTRHDGESRLALAVVIASPGRSDEILAILNAARIAQRAEWAALVRSDLRGRGLGTLLLDELLRRASRLGVQELYAETFPDNQRLLALARRFGHVAYRHAGENLQLRRFLRPEHEVREPATEEAVLTGDQSAGHAAGMSRSMPLQ